MPIDARRSASFAERLDMRIEIETLDSETVKRIVDFANTLGVTCSVTPGPPRVPEWNSNRPQNWYFSAINVISRIGGITAADVPANVIYDLNICIADQTPIALIKAIRGHFNLGLVEARQIVDDLTSIPQQDIPF